MNKKGIDRRDVLKLFGSMAAYAATAKFLSSYLPLGQYNAQTQLPNVIIILFDALSARHMSLYGYKRKTTPNIEKFAESSIVYHHHYSASNFTQSSTASILTGVYPWSHRSLEFFESLLDVYEIENIFSALSSIYQTIAYTHNIHVMNILEQFKADIQLLKPIEELVLFQENHLENDEIVGQYAARRWLQNLFSPSYSLFFNPILTAVSSSKSSKINDDNRTLYPLGVSTKDGYLFKMEDAINWIGQVTAAALNPFFAYFHLLPPHEDYRPRAEFYNRFADDQYRLTVKPEHFFTNGFSAEEQQINCRLYDEYIAHVDSEFGRLLEMLERQGTLENTYLILTSDHGQLFERGIHGHVRPALYESVIHTPLVIRAPGQTQRVNVESPTSSLDLVPTILHLAGQTVPESVEGTVLPALGGTDDLERIIFSIHARRNAKKAPLHKVTFAVIQWPYKLIQNLGYAGFQEVDELYNLQEDPEELKNLAGEKPTIIAALKEELHKNQLHAEEKSLKI
jgi:arylsulfatase